MFKNLTLFRFPTRLDFSTLDAGLHEAALRPVGAMELISRGFVPPHGAQLAQEHGQEAELSQHIGDAIWLSVGAEERLLPAAVVNDLLQKKLSDVEQQQGRRPSDKMRKQLRDDLITELLPRAFVRPTRTDALIDRQHGVCVVNTSSKKSAETVVSEIRRALGSFPALPLNAEVAPRALLTEWVNGETLPEGLSLGEECELREPLEHGAIVKVQQMDLHSDEIQQHLQAGKQVARLGLVLDERISFVLGDDLVVRKFKLLEMATEQLESSERDDLRAEFNARFALFAGEFKRLFSVLEPALQLSRVDD